LVLIVPSVACEELEACTTIWRDCDFKLVTSGSQSARDSQFTVIICFGTSMYGYHGISQIVSFARKGSWISSKSKLLNGKQGQDKGAHGIVGIGMHTICKSHPSIHATLASVWHPSLCCKPQDHKQHCNSLSNPAKTASPSLRLHTTGSSDDLSFQ
jgi:hypothetical protein